MGQEDGSFFRTPSPVDVEIPANLLRRRPFCHLSAVISA
jgi:hypothetical protein